MPIKPGSNTRGSGTSKPGGLKSINEGARAPRPPRDPKPPKR